MANMPFFRVIYRSKHTGVRPQAAGNDASELALGASPAQQPRQIFLSRAFISASSALIESTYFAVSTFGAGARGGGFAVAAAGEATLS